MLQYAALIVDIKNSKKYGDDVREKLQHHLSVSQTYLNALFSQSIEKPVVFSGGDEVQGLFRDPLNAFLYYRFLNMLLDPITIRGGIGVGDWKVKLDDAASTAQDGPVYHHAREAVNRAKSNRYYNLFLVSREPSDENTTVLMDYPLGTSKMRTTKQNEFALIVEILFPLIEKAYPPTRPQGVNQNDSESIVESLCRFKQAISQISSLSEKLREGIKAMQFQWPRGTEIALDEWTSTRSGVISEQEKIAYLPAQTLANLLGMTKQGVNRQIVESRVVQERNSVAFVSQYMKGQVGQ